MKLRFLQFQLRQFFELDPSYYTTETYTNAEQFLLGNGSANLTMSDEAFPSVTQHRFYINCDDWTKVRKIKVKASKTWDDTFVYFGGNVTPIVSLSDNNTVITAEIPANADRNTITYFLSRLNSLDRTCTYSNFTVYDDNNNIIIPTN